jgi:hypothetical protein
MLRTTEAVIRMSQLAAEGIVAGVPVAIPYNIQAGYHHGGQRYRNVPQIETEWSMPMRRAVLQSDGWKAEQKRLQTCADEISKQIENRC